MADGFAVGFTVGVSDGFKVGIAVATRVGFEEGCSDGIPTKVLHKHSKINQNKIGERHSKPFVLQASILSVECTNNTSARLNKKRLK